MAEVDETLWLLGYAVLLQHTHIHAHTDKNTCSGRERVSVIPRTLEQQSPPSPNSPTQTNKSLFINTAWKWERATKKGGGVKEKGRKEKRSKERKNVKRGQYCALKF